MRTLFWQVSATLDGFTEGTQCELALTAGLPDTEFERYATEMLQAIDGFLVGRKTYELFAGFWPQQTGRDADRLNELPKLVASRTLTSVAWSNARLAGETLFDEVRQLKAQPGRDLAVFGSATLANSLLAAGLIDEIRLFLTPHLLGGGTPLFQGVPAPKSFRLVSAVPWPSGTVALTYRPG